MLIRILNSLNRSSAAARAKQRKTHWQANNKRQTKLFKLLTETDTRENSDDERLSFVLSAKDNVVLFCFCFFRHRYYYYYHYYAEKNEWGKKNEWRERTTRPLAEGAAPARSRRNSTEQERFLNLNLKLK